MSGGGGGGGIGGVSSSRGVGFLGGGDLYVDAFHDRLESAMNTG